MMSQNQRRLKIAIVSDTVNAGSGWGGIVTGQHLVNRLSENHDVILISADSEGNNVKLRGIRPTFVPAIKHGKFVFAIPDRKILRKTFAEVDIIHLQLPFWLSFTALDEARKAGKPVVASFHVQPENILYNLNLNWSWLNRKIYEFWIKHLWNHTNLVICPSAFAVQILQKHHLRTRAIAISNGISFDSHSVKYERESKYQNYFLIFMLGRLAPEKEQHTLIKAVQLSPYKDKIKIVIAGRGQNQKKLSKLAAELPNSVEIGFISEERKKQLLATADLFVHCSAVELEGMSVLEALGASLPALVAEGPATAAASLTLPDFRFPVGNAEILAKKLNWLIENPEELKKASQVYKNKAQKFNIVDSIKNIENEYRSLLTRQFTL